MKPSTETVFEVFPDKSNAPSYGLFSGDEKFVREWVATLTNGGFTGRLRLVKRQILIIGEGEVEQLRQADRDRKEASDKVHELYEMLTPRPGIRIESPKE